MQASIAAPMESFVARRRMNLRTFAAMSPRRGEGLDSGLRRNFCNRQRRHSRIGMVLPALFAESFSEQPEGA